MENEKQNKSFHKTIFLSAAVGLIAMALFLAAYFLLLSHKEKVFYEGEGKYSAYMASGSGVSSEYDGLEIDLRSDGSCTVFMDGKEKSGKWKRAGDRVEFDVGSYKMSGALTGDRLEIMSDASDVGLSLRKNSDTAKTAEIPAGRWELVSVTDGTSVYSEELLKKLGYENSYIEIDENGSGTAVILRAEEDVITVTDDALSLHGRLLPFSFSENQLSILYAEGVTLFFER